MIALSDFAGNQPAKQQIISMIKSQHLPHAIIIEGDCFSGRKTLARIIAGFAACAGDNPPCGQCSACKLEQNPDITEIIPNEKGVITVDAVRKVRNDAYILPNNSVKRVFIFENASNINQNGQNALLKVVEEPPQSAMFIFICEYSQQLLETIRSRCVTLHLALPNEQEAEDYINENYNFDEVDVKAAVKQYAGNIGKALNLLNGADSYEKTAEQIALKWLESDIEMLKCFVPYNRDIKALKEITSSLYGVFHNALMAKSGKVRSENAQQLARHATSAQLFAAAAACQKALEDFNTVKPLFAANAPLYATSLCIAARQALSL